MNIHVTDIWQQIKLFTKQSRLLTTLRKKLLKTLQEKEKMLVTRIFSLSHNAFHPSQENFHFLGYIFLSSVNAFDSGHLKYIALGKELCK